MDAAPYLVTTDLRQPAQDAPDRFENVWGWPSLFVNPNVFGWPYRSVHHGAAIGRSDDGFAARR